MARQPLARAPVAPAAEMIEMIRPRLDHDRRNHQQTGGHDSRVAGEPRTPPSLDRDAARQTKLPAAAQGNETHTSGMMWRPER